MEQDLQRRRWIQDRPELHQVSAWRRGARQYRRRQRPQPHFGPLAVRPFFADMEKTMEFEQMTAGCVVAVAKRDVRLKHGNERHCEREQPRS